MKIQIKNIKSIKDFEFDDHESCNFIIAKGMNRIGKTTLSQALRAVITQEAIKGAVTNGEQEGHVVYTGKTVDGNDIVVKWTTKESGDKFTASIVLNERIISLTAKKDIRQLTGNFFRYTSEEIFNLLATEPGKKKFIKEFILTFLSDTMLREYELLSENLSNSPSKPNSYYNQRTEINRRMKDLSSILNKNITVQYNEVEFQNIEQAIKTLDSVSRARKAYTDDAALVDQTINEISGKLMFLNNKIKFEDIVPLSLLLVAW